MSNFKIQGGNASSLLPLPMPTTKRCFHSGWWYVWRQQALFDNCDELMLSYKRNWDLQLGLLSSIMPKYFKLLCCDVGWVQSNDCSQPISETFLLFRGIHKRERDIHKQVYMSRFASTNPVVIFLGLSFTWFSRFLYFFLKSEDWYHQWIRPFQKW